MIDLHERLSEFSYGYGITREVQNLLSDVAIETVPFMPSLIQEDELGFDVGFNRPGAALLLQFKLGQSLRRFVRGYNCFAVPALDKPFFRFSVNTAEPDGQFETLLKAEYDGAETYYVAPIFADWPEYARLFETGAVLEQSILVTPSTIRNALVAQGSPDGMHRVVYDTNSVYVCSEPYQVSDTRKTSLVEGVLQRVVAEGENLAKTVRRIYEGFDHRSSIRRLRPDALLQAERALSSAGSIGERTPEPKRKQERNQRLEQLRKRARIEDDAVSAALGLELWALGIQLILASRD